MSAPLIRVDALVKAYGAATPLEIARLEVGAGDRVVISGLDAGAAETLMHLLTGASLPDEGEVRIDGRLTREIETDTAWLASLDRFGMVTERSVLFEELPVAASVALPLSLSIDPMPPDVRARVEAIAALAGLDAGRLDVPARALTRAERWHVHLARAMAHEPRLLLLERPGQGVEAAAERRAFGGALARAAEARGFGWLAITDDKTFASASGSRRLALHRGTLRRTGWTWPWARRGDA